MKNKHRTLNGGQKKTLLGGPKEKEARKVFRKAMKPSRNVVLALANQKRVHERISTRTKAEARKKKERGKEGAYPQSGHPASEAQSEEGYGHAWESDDWSSSHFPDDSSTYAAAWSCTRADSAWMAAVPLNLTNQPTHVVLDLGCTRSIGSRATIKRFQKHTWYYGITTEFCRCHMSFVLANSATETCLESCIIHFPTTLPCSTRVDVLETGDVPFLFSLPQMKEFGYDN